MKSGKVQCQSTFFSLWPFNQYCPCKNTLSTVHICIKPLKTTYPLSIPGKGLAVISSY